MTELMHRGLPKWPQHYVTGVPVTVEQAKEIIRRTDTFFAGWGGGNNRAFNRKVRELLKMPSDVMDEPRDLTPEETGAMWKRRDELHQAFTERWKPISTSYVHNNWVSCAFIGGPHGWCHPDGQIGFVDNVGKWPDVEDVYKDWVTLAEAFPFIEVGATLFDGEECEDNTRPVVSFAIKDGKVTPVDPAVTDVHAGHPKATRAPNGVRSAIDTFMLSFNDNSREQGLPEAWFHEWAKAFP
jgi:hypothetical protein